MSQLSGLFILDRDAYEAVYAPHAATEINQRVTLLAPPQTRASIKNRFELLHDVDLLFSGWGAPKIDKAFLDAAPNLKVIFYAAGAINSWASTHLWERGIIVTTANYANAIPTAEYTVATILFSLKNGWRLAGQHQERLFRIRPEIPGNYQSVVALLAMGTVARLVVRLLRPFGMKILTYDPFLSLEEAASLGVHSVTLEELFKQADVVSLHPADLPTTSGMVTGKLIASMKKGATLINTSRGRVIREDEMIDVLHARPDLQAVLDVTREASIGSEARFEHLSNVVLTPHIAGSQGRECQRLGQFMVDELDNYLNDRPLRWRVDRYALAHSVHQFAST